MFDIDRFMCHAALDVIGVTAYGKSFNAMTGKSEAARLVAQNFVDAQEMILQPCIAFVLFFSYFF